MTTIYADISGALDGLLDTFATANSLQVAWEGLKFDPPDALYLRQFLIPLEVEQAELGETGQDLHNGIYQVDIVVEAGTGQKEVLEMLDKLGDHFKRGTKETYQSVTVKIVQNSRDQTATATERASNEKRMFIPVNIEYEVFSSAR